VEVSWRSGHRCSSDLSSTVGGREKRGEEEGGSAGFNIEHGPISEGLEVRREAACVHWERKGKQKGGRRGKRVTEEVRECAVLAGRRWLGRKKRDLKSGHGCLFRLKNERLGRDAEADTRKRAKMLLQEKNTEKEERIEKMGTNIDHGHV